MLRKSTAALWAATMLLFGGGCDTQCLSAVENFFPPTAGEYRLLLSNGSSFMVELLVDEESLGVFCPGVQELWVGNFRQRSCSQIRVEFFDISRHKDLDDCSVTGERRADGSIPEDAYCLTNNTENRTCFDTTLNVETVRAEIR